MTGTVGQRAALDTSAAYKAAFEGCRSKDLREKLHSLAHDPRIPDGLLRAWAFRLMRRRAGDVDHQGNHVLYPCPPSARCPLSDIQLVDRIVCRDLIPDFRSPRWRELRETPVLEDDRG